MANERTTADDASKTKAKADKPTDIVDESTKESFPASDAPTSWAGKDIAPQDRKPPAQPSKKS